MKKQEKSESITYKLESGISVVAYPGDDIYEHLVKLVDSGEPLIINNEEFFSGIGKAKMKVPWNYRIGITNVNNKLSSIPMPASPKSLGKEYQFPEIADISSPELGEWLMKLSAWKGYVLKLLSKAEIERIVIDESYDTIIAKGYAAADKAGKKVTKDIVLGSSISENEGFRELRIKLIEKKAEVEALKRIIDIYSTQLDAISREISRRGQEINAIGKTL